MGYDRTDVSEDIDNNKAGDSQGKNVVRCWYLSRNIQIQSCICYGFHDIMQNSLNFDDVAIVCVGENYRRIYSSVLPDEKL